jgi:hypothetical protein
VQHNFPAVNRTVLGDAAFDEFDLEEFPVRDYTEASPECTDSRSYCNIKDVWEESLTWLWEDSSTWLVYLAYLSATRRARHQTGKWLVSL